MSSLSDHATTQATQRWVVDPARSTVEFRVRNFWGLATVVGHFLRFDGSYTVGGDGRAVELIVDAGSLDTGARRRDGHLRSCDFFDVERHPHVRFTANEITDAGNGALRVRGELEAAGRRVPLPFEAPVRELDGELEVEATTLVDHRLFGTVEGAGVDPHPARPHGSGLMTRRSQVRILAPRLSSPRYRARVVVEDNTRARATELLEQMLGAGAAFRPGQLEAIETVVDQRSRVLVIQRTGWGKSLVYLLATRLLRDAGFGPTLLISPLLSLMRDQLLMAERIGVRAATMNSENVDEWGSVEQALAADELDLLLVSPERLANAAFAERTLGLIGGAIGLFVVDEAHCISDWGHDFRPNYRRIGRLVARLPRGVPLLSTTATANDRVVADIESQLGPELITMRGPLARESLRLQTIALDDQAERLAWLAEHLPGLPGSGIVYCLTIADCERVAGWLASRGLEVAAYYGDLDPAIRRELEERLRTNRIKALVATIALGMGFDKPDLGFVVHFQRPGSPVAYYQQIGRAGRALDDALVVLLHGREDDEIVEYFIRGAFPPEDDLRAVLDQIAENDGLRLSDLEVRLNLSHGRIERCLKVLEIDGAIFREGARYVRSANPWHPEHERIASVTAQREHELARMQEFTLAGSCLMEFLGRELDDPAAAPCGRCAVCAGDFLPREVDPALLRDAVLFLRRAYRVIESRRRWPAGGADDRRGNIRPGLQAEEGRALSIYGDAGWGRLVSEGKYREERFDEELVEAAAEMIEEAWQPEPAPCWVTAIPSLRTDIVPDYARRLAQRLGLPYRDALVKMRDNPRQKQMENSYQRVRNVADVFRVDTDQLAEDPVLLVDDIVDSRWSITVCAALLREAGSGPVHPLALASAARGGT